MICMNLWVSRFPSSVWMLYVCNIVFCCIHPHKRLCLKKCWSVKVLRWCAPPLLLFFFFFLQYEAMYPFIVLKQVFEARLWTRLIALYLKLLANKIIISMYEFRIHCPIFNTYINRLFLFIEIHRKIKANVSTSYYTFKRLSYQCNITVTFQWLWQYKTTDKHKQYTVSLSNELRNSFLDDYILWKGNMFYYN